MAVAVLISACGGTPVANLGATVASDAPPTPTGTAEPPQETDADDAVDQIAPATPTGTAEPQQETDADDAVDQIAPATPTGTAEPQQEDPLFFSLDPDATWQDVFDNVTASEQSCIREVLGGELRESAMAMPVFDIFEETAPRQWELPMISCLLPESTQVVFIPKFMAVISRIFHDDIGIELSLEEFVCLRDRVHEIGITAVLSAFTSNDDAETTKLLFGTFACVPDLFYSPVANAMGVEPRELSEDERECLQEWAEGLEGSDLAALLSSEDNSPAAVEFGFGLFACVPDLLFSIIGEELGVDPLAMSKDQETCIGEWIKGIDEDDVAVFLSPDEDLAATLEIFFGVYTCIPILLLSSFAEGLGVELGELSEDQESCLQDWMVGLDEDDLAVFASPDEDPAATLEFLLGMFACLPDLPIPDLAEDSINEAI